MNTQTDAGADQEPIRLTISEDGHLFDRQTGRRIVAEQLPSDVHIATEIPTYLAGYSNPDFRADEVSKPVTRTKLTGYYRTKDPRDAYQPVNVKLAITAWVKEITPRSATTLYTMEHRGIGTFVNDMTEMEAEGIAWDPRREAGVRCYDVMLLDREIDVWAMLKNAANWASANYVTLLAGFQWNGGVNSDPLGDIQNMIISSPGGISDIYLTQVAAFALLRHPSVAAQTRFMLGDQALQTTIQQVHKALQPGTKVDFELPGYPPFHVANAAIWNETTQSVGPDDTILGGDVIGVMNLPGDPTDGRRAPTSQTFRLPGAGDSGIVTREFRIEGRGPRGGTFLVVSQAEVPVMISSFVGGVIHNAIQ